MRQSVDKLSEDYLKVHIKLASRGESLSKKEIPPWDSFGKDLFQGLIIRFVR